MQQIRKAIQDGDFILDLKARRLREVLHQVCNFLVARNRLSAESRDDVERALLEREKQYASAIGHSVAVPHVYLEAFDAPVAVFVRLKHPMNLGAPDGLPVRYIFVLAGPPDSTAVHLETLAAIARLMSDDEFRYEALTSRSKQDLLQAFQRFVVRSQPPEEQEPVETISEGLQFTGRFAGGLIADIRRRWAVYASDFTDGLHSKCLGSILFLYFACLAPTVTFGGLMAQQTNGQIGTVEMILSGAICGVVYALFAGQPLNILGGTGPMLVYTVTLYALSQQLKLPFLPIYACVGVWTALFLIVMSLTDVSALMRYFTRFTDEIFAALISLIFIYEAVMRLVETFTSVYRDKSNTHDEAFLTLILALGTFFVASNLSRFRRSRYLHGQLREFLADFGPAIALATMTLVAIYFHGEVTLDALAVPDEFGPTVERSWFIDISASGLPTWAIFGSALPALFAAILIYLDQNITARLVNSPDHKLTKGVAYHLDLLVIGLLVGGCSLFGLPWFVAATVRSLNHLRSLATMEEVVQRNGETRERVVHVRENRITGAVIHLLIGLSLLLLPLLKMIPLAVLYGIFLYMGVVSMKGNQFFQRLALLPMDPSLYPRTHYIRRVPMRTIHAFTLLQLACLAILWILRIGPPTVAILFPLMIALLVPVRMLAGRIFQPEHLAALDSNEEPDDDADDWGAG